MELTLNISGWTIVSSDVFEEPVIKGSTTSKSGLTMKKKPIDSHFNIAAFDTLIWKCAKFGTDFKKVNPAYTTQICSCCGNKMNLTL